nr:immunoglobulin light chain junction region [Macaca mulatta]
DYYCHSADGNYRIF